MTFSLRNVTGLGALGALLLLGAALPETAVAAEAGNIPTVASMAAARALAAERSIPILVDFSADW